MIEPRTEGEPDLGVVIPARNEEANLPALYDELRFARLCTHLRNREPDARVTNALLVYELSESQLNAALQGPAQESTRFPGSKR